MVLAHIPSFRSIFIHILLDQSAYNLMSANPIVEDRLSMNAVSQHLQLEANIEDLACLMPPVWRSPNRGGGLELLSSITPSP